MRYDELVVIENIRNPNEYLLLRHSLGWNMYELIDAEKSLRNSLYCVSIYQEKSIIGMGRIVGDNCLCFYVQDIMVKPEYQRRGVGTLIMNHIMLYLKEHAEKNAYIGLMSKLDVSNFYEKFGFICRPNETMGPGMVIPNYDPGNFRARNSQFLF